MKLPPRSSRVTLLALAAPLLGSCASDPVQVVPASAPLRTTSAESSWVVEPTWKERLPQHFVYVELRGDYRAFGAGMRRFLDTLGGRGLELSGPPFGLFFDDPARVAPEELRAWACVPTEAAPKDLPAGCAEGDLPGGLVVYAQVRGVGPETAHAYGELLALAKKFGWTPSTPVREVYLVDPAAATSGPQWFTEIQIACSGT